MIISYQEYRRLYLGAQDCATADQYIAEEGGSVPGVDEDTDAAIALMQDIWACAHDTGSLRKVAGLTQAAFAAKYGLPARTVCNYDYHVSDMPGWSRALLAYAVCMDRAARRAEALQDLGYEIVPTDVTTEVGGVIRHLYAIPGLKPAGTRPFLTSQEECEDFLAAALARGYWVDAHHRRHYIDGGEA